MAGLFEVLVTFNKDVYTTATAQETRTLAEVLAILQAILSATTYAISMEMRWWMGKCYSVARVDTDADTTMVYKVTNVSSSRKLP